MPSLVAVVPIFISVAAFSVSLLTFVLNQRRDRRDLFLKFHERLVDPDLQQGRSILIDTVRSVADVEALQKARPADYDLVRRSLAMFDIFGMYVRRGFIDKDLVLEEWGRTFAKVAEHGQYFIDHRGQSQGWASWPNLREFGAEARKWVAATETDTRWRLEVSDEGSLARGT